MSIFYEKYPLIIEGPLEDTRAFIDFITSAAEVKFKSVTLRSVTTDDIEEIQERHQPKVENYLVITKEVDNQ